MTRKKIIVRSVLSLVAATGLVALAREKPEPVEQERSVREADVPAEALAALKTLAAGAAFTEFAEEIEYGHTFYEGSWMGRHGNIDALVTRSGDLVEIEETVPFGQVPAAARAVAEKEAGQGAEMLWEKKTLVLYEVHYKKDGKGREVILTPDGRRFHEDTRERQSQHDNEEDD